MASPQANGDVSGVAPAPLDVLGDALEAGAVLLASAVFLQALLLPLDGPRMGWWPVAAATLTLAASLCFRTHGNGDTTASAPGHWRIFRLRLSAIFSLGLSPMLTMLPWSIRVTPLHVGWHLAVCVIGVFAAMIWHQMEVVSLQRTRRCTGKCRLLADVDALLWLRCLPLLFGMTIVCVALLVVASGEFRIGRLPDAVLQGVAGFGQVPVLLGWASCAACAVSGVLRLVMFVTEDLHVGHTK